MKVVLIDDHQLVRRGIRAMLEAKGVEVVCDLEPHEGALEQAYACRPDAVLLDLGMPGEGGLTLLKTWKESYPAIAVMIVSMHVEDPWVTWAMAAGADGYLSKSCGPDELFAALQTLLEGGRPLCAEVMAVLQRQARGPKEPKLTPRELEVLRHVCQGADLAELARHFTFSHNTAKTHLHSLYRKMKVSDRAQLLLKAKTLGLHG